MKNIIFFTDGASRGNPGPGGYGVVMVHGDTIQEFGGPKDPTTNNEMELQAVVTALTQVPKGATSITIYTDSQYVVSGATAWIFGWMKNGWQTKAKEAVLNKELWQELQPLLQQHNITWKKIPGHVDLVGNERADTIASTYAAGEEPGLYTGPKADYDIDIDDVTWDEAKAAERSAARERSRQPAHSYVSAVGGVVEIHQTWAACEARVKGKPGAKFKKALNEAEERLIVQSFTT